MEINTLCTSEFNNVRCQLYHPHAPPHEADTGAGFHFRWNSGDTEAKQFQLFFNHVPVGVLDLEAEEFHPNEMWNALLQLEKAHISNSIWKTHRIEIPY